jgi:Phospholipase_D-nuclease N-terminal
MTGNMEDSNIASEDTPPASAGTKKKWSDLPPARRKWIVVQAVIQLSLTALALWDLYHRPADKVRGNKRWWAIGALVQPFGPVAYLLFGRKR